MTNRLTAVFTTLVLSLSTAVAQAPLSSVHHVFLIILENKDYSETFSATPLAPYLANTLPAQGELLTNYYGIGHNSLINYMAMISGQAPNTYAQSDCQTYQDFDSTGVTAADGQLVGQGCVFPSGSGGVITVADQLAAANLTWHGYMEDMPSPCYHPALNSVDSTQDARYGDQYATRHNPFMYFHSIIDSTSCAANDVPLTNLTSDLQSISTTANFSFITPNLCDDGHDSPCVTGQRGGLVQINAFLQKWVPLILNSPAYKQDGVLIITFDEAEFESADSDSTDCCNEIPGPNSPTPGIAGPGGGRIGAVLLSPFIAPGTVNQNSYNHYSLLATIEDIFGLGRLGFAETAMSFGSDVFNQ